MILFQNHKNKIKKHKIKISKIFNYCEEEVTRLRLRWLQPSQSRKKEQDWRNGEVGAIFKIRDRKMFTKNPVLELSIYRQSASRLTSTKQTA
jgi:hypothetical protein